MRRQPSSRAYSAKPFVPDARNSRNRYSARKANRQGVIVYGLSIMWRLSKLAFSGIFIVALIGGLSAGLVLGYYYLENSNYFQVRKVVLEGLNRVTHAEVLSRTGLDKPTNILSIRASELTENIRQIPWVEDVVLTRQLPDTVIVQIKERRPRTLINLGSLYYLDENGRPFKKIDPREKPELPIITGFTREDFDEKHQAFRKEEIDEVFSLLEVMAERNDNFRVENISEINFDPVRGLNVFTRNDNLQVKIGLGDYRAKMRRLGRVMAHLKIRGQSEGLSYINLECSPRVIIRRAVKS